MAQEGKIYKFQPCKEGWLMKKSDFLGQWRRRYFCLDDKARPPELNFSKSQDYDFHGAVELVAGSTISAVSLSESPYGIAIITPSKTWTMYAVGLQEQQEWIDILNATLQK